MDPSLHLHVLLWHIKYMNYLWNLWSIHIMSNLMSYYSSSHLSVRAKVIHTFRLPVPIWPVPGRNCPHKPLLKCQYCQCDVMRKCWKLAISFSTVKYRVISAQVNLSPGVTPSLSPQHAHIHTARPPGAVSLAPVVFTFPGALGMKQRAQC